MKTLNSTFQVLQHQLAQRAACVVATVCAAWTGGALGQADSPMVFVANNGNLEGSVTSLMVNSDDTLTFVDKLITGTDDDPGTNAQTISLTPNGRYLCTGHGTKSETVEELNIIEVASDGTLSLVGTFLTDDSPLDVEWLTDEYLAVTKTNIFVTNEVIIYEFDPAGPSLTEIDRETTGTFNTVLAVDPEARYLYTQDSSGSTIRSFAVNSNGTIDPADTVSTGSTFPLGIGVSPNGMLIYGGGGISSGGNAIVGYTIDTSTGAMTVIPGSPFTSPGASPKQVVVSSDNKFAIVAHGTDATVRTFDIDAGTGALSPTGISFDVGLQGSLGEVQVLGDLVLVTDNTTALDGMAGVYSFTLGADGSLNMNGSIVDTQGISPGQIDTWTPVTSCPADLTDGSDGMPDGVVNVFDLLALLSGWGGDGSGSDLAKPNDVVNVFDLLELLAQWGPCE